MPQQQPNGTTPSRLERELERERHEHTSNHDAKAGLGPAGGEHLKDARENFESGKVRR